MNENRYQLLQEEPVIINIGISEFFQSLVDQEIDVVQVHWHPPAEAAEEVMDLLNDLL